MLIWFCLLIPVLSIIILSIFFKKKINVWEYLALFLIPLIAIVISYFTSVNSQTKDVEYLNSYITSASYYEYWSTWDHETCTREDCTGSGEDRKCHTETYDCSHCDESFDYWEAVDNTGKTYRISRSYFEELCKLWNNRTFIDMRRNIVHHGTCGQDGDMYTTVWNNQFETIVPICNIQNYTNKIQCSRSVFNFQEVDSFDIKDYGLYEYPVYDQYNYNPLIGSTDVSVSKRLSRWNAKLGNFKQVHMLVALYNNKPIQSAIMQESYWKGGNKNEFILCIGLKDNKEIAWTKVISWTDVDKLKISLEQNVLNMEYNLNNIIDTVGTNVQKYYKRKEFKDFNYLNIEPTSKAIIITFIITLVLTIGISIYSVLNDFDFKNKYYY